LGVEINPEKQSIKFQKTLFHPNVASNGQLSFTRRPRWPYQRYELVNIASQLLSTPDLSPANIANGRAAQLYRGQPWLYFKYARASAE
jgi:hypothetical protein